MDGREEGAVGILVVNMIKTCKILKKMIKLLNLLKRIKDLKSLYLGKSLSFHFTKIFKL